MTDHNARAPAGSGAGATERFPMTETTWRRLSDEEQRLSDISRRAGPGRAARPATLPMPRRSPTGSTTSTPSGAA